ncbi:uncharacterized protein LOC103315356 [Nasonia vitripennis]|uniref:Uncharacterized protein n=1 Tax=Nasonia vitripennis TaxID=7425 RepID=A0A7M7QIX0_NASVI|nr:uncharacterized protein LOC103315356 [Nasonia vitripennis]XP_031786263.1 uncharacterized protein LOC103315356 [Nasonia vitripennis]XP_031786264.1 uncharacterized protein LOC103315356 [Nasonia vitripennis]
MSPLTHLRALIICSSLSLPFLQSSVVASSRRSRSSSSHHRKSRGCEKLNRFLQDVLKVQNDLSWIDQMADILRSKNMFSASPVLQEKINAMFFTAKNQNKMNQRRKRHSNHRSKLRLETESHNSQLKSSIQGYENASSQNFNPATSEISTTTTTEPLEKVLQSINVFPVDSTDPIALKSGDDSAESDDDFFEGIRLGRALKSISKGGDSRVNNFTKLLLMENEGDKSQMNRALHGDLAKEIVNAIFDQMKNREAFHKMTNFGYEYDVNPQDSVVIDNMYRRERDFETDDATASITKKLMTVVQQLISEEIEKKSCPALPPDLQDFLQWLVQVEAIDRKDSETLNVKQEQSITNNNPGDGSFSIVDLNEWYTKAETLKSLLNEYEGLSKREKNKVRAIHEYLVTRLEFVKAYLEAFKSHPLHGINS